MELRRVRTFLALAELGSLARTADHLRIAQTALSRQIRLVEEEIGMPLFTRHSRGMELTEAGVALAKLVSGPVRQLELAAEEVRATDSEPSGRVAIGVMPSVVDILAGRLAERVARELPKISLRVAEGSASHLIEWLQRGELDATLSYSPPRGAGLQIVELIEEQMLLIGSKTSNLSMSVSISCRALADYKLVLPSLASGLRSIVVEAAAATATPLSVIVEADAYPVLMHLVERGVGYTVLPMSAVARELAAMRLRAAPLVEPSLTRRIVLLERSRGPASRATQAVLAILVREIGQLVKDGDWPGVPLAGLQSPAIA